MTLSIASTTLQSLQGAQSSQDLVKVLVELKNMIIGNTLKKVEMADDEALLEFLLTQLETTEINVTHQVAVVLGTLASEGTLTIKPILLAGAHNRLLKQVQKLVASTDPQAPKILTAVLRALRNVLVSTADLVWGHAYGVEMEKKVVGTGLVGISVNTGKGKAVADREMQIEAEAVKALGLVFKPENLDIMLSLLESRPNRQSAFPLYQIYSRLVVLPSHREMLARWRPPESPSVPSESATAPVDLPYILVHLVNAISHPHNTKTLEAALDLLAVLVQDQPGFASKIKKVDIGSRIESAFGVADSSKQSTPYPNAFIILLESLIETSQSSVRISVAACITNIIKIHQSTANPRFNIDARDTVLKNVSELWRTESTENKLKLCYIIAHLVADDAQFQESALETFHWPSLAMDLLHNIELGEGNGELGFDLAARGREAALLALAALTGNYERARMVVAESDPPMLPLLVSALSHPSYGVRAAACQLARSLSRTVSLVRTSLLDSKIPEAVAETLERECRSREARAKIEEMSWHDLPQEEEQYLQCSRTWAVEITAMMALSNYVADYSPFKEALLNYDAFTQVAILAHSSHEGVAVNALWMIKNAMFKSTEPMKKRILQAVGVEWLKRYMSQLSPVDVRIQAFGIVQNYLADGSLADLYACVGVLGEDHLLECIGFAAKQNQPAKLRVAAFGVLVNLCWGNERLRQSIIIRSDLVRALSDGLVSPDESITYAALKALRNLITSTTKSERPRMNVLDAFQGHDIKNAVKTLAETSPSIDISVVAIALHEVLERARSGHDIVREDPLDR